MPTGKAKPKRKSSTRNSVRSTRLFKASARSRITNGSTILANVDGRTFWVRRFRDLNSLLLSDQGGDDNVTEPRRMLVRRAACLAVELERREAVIAETGEATDAQIEVYGRTANTLRRLLQTLGLERRARDVTPTLQSYLATHYPSEEPFVESSEESTE